MSAGGHGAATSHGIVIAVDGPSASGKSSASRGAARALGLRYLDTGSMYRALTWWMLARGIPADEPAAVALAASEPIIEVGTDPDGPWVRVDGQDVSAAVRTQEVTSAVSAVARVPQVRARLIALQREIIARARAEGRGIVAEGRDIGTVVAPDAVVKVYLTASERARAQRRTAESAASPDLTAIAGQLSAGQVGATQADQARRDRMDSGQLARADDAVEIDSTMFGLDDVIGMIAGLAQERAGLTDTARTTR
ncbi:MAG TPA: (d)CMP kinase [Streptosporangiaceae bacterium]